MADTIATQVQTVRKGASSFIPAKVGIIERTITVGGVADEADDVIQVFSFEDRTLVLAAGLEVMTPTTNSITGALGLATGTEFLGESDISAAAGTAYSGGQAKANVLIAAADTMDLNLSGDAGAAGSVRVWAVIADVEELDGS